MSAPAAVVVGQRRDRDLMVPAMNYAAVSGESVVVEPMMLEVVAAVVVVASAGFCGRLEQQAKE